MKTVQQTIESLGSPLWIEPLGQSDGREALIARWHHGDARVPIALADAIRVVLSLSTAQQVRYADRSQAVSTRSLPGHVSVFPAGVASETTVEGEADVIQIFINPESLAGIGRETLAATPLVASTSDELKLAAIQLLVAARHEDGSLRGAAERRLRQAVGHLLASPGREPSQDARAGPPPAAVRTVEQLIAHAMNHATAGHPSLKELAAAAGLSVNHFIRGFHRASGTTPHQLLMLRRCERAMDLLRQPGLTVADVSDAAGYASPAYFVAAFRQRLGVTPGAYQRAVGGVWPARPPSRKR